MKLRELVDEFTGWGTDDMDKEMQRLFATDPDLIAHVDRTLMQLDEDKRGPENRQLIIDLLIGNVIMACHIREAM